MLYSIARGPQSWHLHHTTYKDLFAYDHTKALGMFVNRLAWDHTGSHGEAQKKFLASNKMCFITYLPLLIQLSFRQPKSTHEITYTQSFKLHTVSSR